MGYTTLTSGEVLRLLDASGTSLRDQALILVMLGGGLRVSEVSGLDCSDLVQDGGRLAFGRPSMDIPFWKGWALGHGTAPGKEQPDPLGAASPG